MSVSSSTTSSTDAVDIRLWIMRHMIVHDEVDIVHIESTRGNIRSDKNSNISFLECFEGIDTISLEHVSVDKCRRESITMKVTFEFLGFVFSCGKDHRLVSREALEDTLEERVFIPNSYSHEYMIYRVNSWGFWENERLISVSNIGIEHLSDIASIGRGESHHLFESRELSPDLLHGRSKSHIHHLIYFIENEDRDILESDSASLNEIDETTWSSNDHLWAISKCIDLTSDRRTTVDGEWTHSHITGNIEHFITSLEREFTSWLKDEHLWSSFLWIDIIERWDDKSGRFPAPGMRLNDDIFAIESKRNHLRLYLGWLMVSELGEGRDDLLSESKGIERHRKKKNKKINYNFT
jgi:hypothetical protein